ncbi:hypothetical protein CJ030_MR6G018857 [Morella rubra]|uniref:Uncharacterized protein n=1 Tax=Morella rubra TaxID=262757 RepID=A0A6A1VC85_9ROSI|nr:hypothetical protein CJ030_MR6G018857 [Morella rubra]
MGFDVDANMADKVDADMADNPAIIPSPTRVPDPTSSFDTQFTTFEERLTNMHEVQKKFLEESLLLCKRSKGSSLRR